MNHVQSIFLLVPTLLGAPGAPVQRAEPSVKDLTPDVGRFQVENSISVAVPEGTKALHLWFPLPRLDPEQEVAELEIEAPEGWRKTSDANGNRYVYLQMSAPSGKVQVVTRFLLTRHEVNADVDPAKTKPLSDAEKAQFAAELRSDTHVVVDDGIRELAASIRGDEQNPVLVARKLYDWTLANIEYWVKDPAKWKASPVGSSAYCLESRTGNCTDFHSLWTALARASGVPTRMKYGSIFKPSLDGVDRDASYHCWPELYAPGLGWIPHDVAVADIFVAPIAIDDNNKDKVTLTTATGYAGPDPAWVDYYFGNLEARRVTWSLGRDLTLEPRQSAGPVNAIPKGYVEIDGKELTGWERKMTYREVK